MDNIFLNYGASEFYALGLIWADGSVTRAKINHIRVTISVLKDDFLFFEPALLKLGPITVSYSQRPNRREQGFANIRNQPLNRFLAKLDYLEKSKRSPCKILSIIPNEFKRDFLRGLIDGDGCFYVGKTYEFTLAGSFEQDWTAIENMLQTLNIKYLLNRKKQIQNGRKNKHSFIRITRNKSLKSLISYIYYDDCVCLPRKKAKADLIALKEIKWERGR